jgi:hypothetical protein
MAIMVYAPVLKRGIWAFMRPLTNSVWLMLLTTILIMPIFVVFFESLFSGRCAPYCHLPCAAHVTDEVRDHRCILVDS